MWIGFFSPYLTALVFCKVCFNPCLKLKMFFIVFSINSWCDVSISKLRIRDGKILLLDLPSTLRTVPTGHCVGAGIPSSQ